MSLPSSQLFLHPPDETKCRKNRAGQRCLSLKQNQSSRKGSEAGVNLARSHFQLGRKPARPVLGSAVGPGTAGSSSQHLIPWHTQLPLPPSNPLQRARSLSARPGRSGSHARGGTFNTQQLRTSAGFLLTKGSPLSGKDKIPSCGTWREAPTARARDVGRVCGQGLISALGSALLCSELIKMSPLITTEILQGGRLCVVPGTKQAIKTIYIRRAANTVVTDAGGLIMNPQVWSQVRGRRQTAYSLLLIKCRLLTSQHPAVAGPAPGRLCLVPHGTVCLPEDQVPPHLLISLGGCPEMPAARHVDARPCSLGSQQASSNQPLSILPSSRLLRISPVSVRREALTPSHLGYNSLQRTGWFQLRPGDGQAQTCLRKALSIILAKMCPRRAHLCSVFNHKSNYFLNLSLVVPSGHDHTLGTGSPASALASADTGPCSRRRLLLSKVFAVIISQILYIVSLKANIKYLLFRLASVLILHNCSTVYFI